MAGGAEVKYEVKRVNSGIAKSFIRENHYSKSCHNGPSPCYGLFDEEVMIGVLAFSTPCSENVRRFVFGKGEECATIELHRLFVHDVTPKNTESYFISKCLKLLKIDRPKTRVVVSFSDSTEGHRGTIYAASNFIMTGKTGRATFYRDSRGSLRHPRQNGINITKDMAIELGWIPEIREAKTRWHFPLGDNRIDNRKIRDTLLRIASNDAT